MGANKSKHSHHDIIKQAGNTLIKPTLQIPNYKPGEQFLIQQKELERVLNVIGGSQRVELFLSLKSTSNELLPNLSIDVSVTSPKDTKNLVKMGNTSSFDPIKQVFVTSFKLDYWFEIHQRVKFDVFCNGQLCEEVESTLGRIFGARGQTAEFPLQRIPDITLVANMNTINEESENMAVCFEILPNFNRSSYYYVLLSEFLGGKYMPIYKSAEQQLQTFKFNIPLNLLCNGNQSQPILFEFVDNQMGIVGRYQGSLNDISLANGVVNINNTSCSIKFKIEKGIKFLDYIKYGLQMSIMCAIDFTASNGNPKEPSSKHYINGYEPNAYEQSLRSCCSIVAYYDYDNRFPVYGFGAILPGRTETSMCFPCTLQQDPMVNGVEEIVNSYKYALSNVKLNGPTYFSPILKALINIVTEEMNKTNANTYYTFLILTDGQINDFDQTANLICQAAYLPISIIIIGIGNDDFGLMEQLDGDETPLRDSFNRPCVRDIVQFVKYNNFKTDPEMLSREVLHELPGQVETYFKKIKSFDLPQELK
jgi:hypothetical protein